MRRILITGSRDWDDQFTLRNALVEAHYALTQQYPDEDIVLVSGHCPTGADAMCERVFYDSKLGKVHIFPANWEAHGKRAGFLRNAQMVNLGADICLAFIKNNSKGATMTKNLAEKAGIPVREYRQ